MSEQKRKMEHVGWWDALLVGVAQAVALIPGVSRSGVTITAARWASLNRESAVRFSFLLSTPAIVGAALLTFKDYLKAGSENGFGVFLVGFIAAATCDDGCCRWGRKSGRGYRRWNGSCIHP